MSWHFMMKWRNGEDESCAEFDVISWQVHKKKPSILIKSTEPNPEIADVINNDSGDLFGVVGKEFLDYDARFMGFRILLTLKRFDE